MNYVLSCVSESSESQGILSFSVLGPIRYARAENSPHSIIVTVKTSISLDFSFFHLIILL